MMTEDTVASKVAELMETMDQIKKYKVVTESLKKFGIIVGGSVTVFFATLTLFEILEFDKVLNTTWFFVIASLSLLVPIAGLLGGMLFMRNQIKSVKEGEWRQEISKGFSSNLKLLIDMNWEKTLDDISNGRFGYAVYSLIKVGTYIIVAVSAFELFWNGLTLILFQSIVYTGAIFWGLFAILLVVIMLASDLVNRYRELRALDALVWELRWFSYEFGRAEFQT
jgi:hypothetical protein